MGKVRVNTIGDEAAEAKQKLEAEKRRAAKRTTKNTDVILGTSETRTPESLNARDAGQASMTEKKKMIKKSSGKIKKRSPRYTASKKFADKSKTYGVNEALDFLFQMQKAKFDETVELHINTTDKVNGSVVLPNGTGKQTRVAILAPASNAAAAEKLLQEIESGKINFDVLIATPDAMPKLAKVARILGPRGLMPNPKTGTVTTKPEEVAKQYEGGQVSFKTEAKANIIHLSIGKVSFGKEKLSENIKAFMKSLDNSKVKNVYLKSTMSPSIKLEK